MVAIVLGLMASLSIGASSFVGGLIARRVPAMVVVVLSQAAGLAALLAALPFILGEPARAGALGWGALAGILGGLGLMLVYRGLARGRMSIVAPTSAVIGATIPVVVGVLIGERPGTVALAGLLVALLAIGLISAVPESKRAAARNVEMPHHRSGVPEAIASGVFFGGFFLAFNAAGDAGGGAWPLLAARVASVTLFGAVVVRGGFHPLRVGRMLPRIVIVGVLDTGAILMVLVASRLGVIPTVAVLTSLHPATTVLLARTILRERMSAVQIAGLAAAGAGVALIGVG